LGMAPRGKPALGRRRTIASIVFVEQKFFTALPQGDTESR
jgi:hypothetical protein